jgi:hypothetical protein
MTVHLLGIVGAILAVPAGLWLGTWAANITTGQYDREVR